MLLLPPAATRAEADELFKKLAQTTADTLKIPLGEAETRVEALLQSGIMDNGHPDSPQTRLLITAFLSIPAFIIRTVVNFKSWEQYRDETWKS